MNMYIHKDTMPNFIQLIPRLIMAAIAGVVLFFFLTIGFLIAIAIAIIGFVLALIFLRKHTIRFGNNQAFIFTSRNMTPPTFPSATPDDGEPIVEIHTETHSHNTSKMSQEKPCIDLDAKDYHVK